MDTILLDNIKKGKEKDRQNTFKIKLILHLLFKVLNEYNKLGLRGTTFMQITTNKQIY